MIEYSTLSTCFYNNRNKHYAQKRESYIIWEAIVLSCNNQKQVHMKKFISKMKNFVIKNDAKIIGIGIGVVIGAAMPVCIFKAGESYGERCLGEKMKNLLKDIANGEYDDQLIDINVGKEPFKESAKELLCRIDL